MVRRYVLSGLRGGTHSTAFMKKWLTSNSRMTSTGKKHWGGGRGGRAGRGAGWAGAVVGEHSAGPRARRRARGECSAARAAFHAA